LKKKKEKKRKMNKKKKKKIGKNGVYCWGNYFSSPQKGERVLKAR
jgi:hypothetical protein